MQLLQRHRKTDPIRTGGIVVGGIASSTIIRILLVDNFLCEGVLKALGAERRKTKTTTTTTVIVMNELSKS